MPFLFPNLLIYYLLRCALVRFYSWQRFVEEVGLEALLDVKSSPK